MLADVIIKKDLPSTKIRGFCKEYDRDPKQDLDNLADRIMGVALVSVPASTLTDEQKKALDGKKSPKKSQKGQPKKRTSKEQVRKAKSWRATNYKPKKPDPHYLSWRWV